MINQPNLQAIITGAIDSARLHQDVIQTRKVAIDAIYAGLLAVIGEDLGEGDDETFAYYENQLRARQRQALKRWCYGDDK